MIDLLNPMNQLIMMISIAMNYDYGIIWQTNIWTSYKYQGNTSYIYKSRKLWLSVSGSRFCSCSSRAAATSAT